MITFFIGQLGMARKANLDRYSTNRSVEDAQMNNYKNSHGWLGKPQETREKAVSTQSSRKGKKSCRSATELSLDKPWEARENC